jgi:hypothetical protein
MATAADSDLTTSHWYDRLIDVGTKLLAFGAATTTFVYLAGGLVYLTRLYHYDLPAETLVSYLPRELLISTGLLEVVGPAITVTVVAFVLVYMGGIRDLLSRAWSLFFTSPCPWFSHQQPWTVTRWMFTENAIDAAKRVPESREPVEPLWGRVATTQGVIAAALIVALPMPVEHWHNAVTAGIALIIACWVLWAFLLRLSGTARDASRDGLTPVGILVFAGIAAVALLLLVILAGWEWPSWWDLGRASLAVISAFVFFALISAAKTRANLIKDPEDEGRHLAEIAWILLVLTGLSVAPWFIEYARLRTLQPVRICFAKGEPPVKGVYVGETPDRVYLGRPTHHSVESFAISDTTAIILGWKIAPDARYARSAKHAPDCPAIPTTPTTTSGTN